MLITKTIVQRKKSTRSVLNSITTHGDGVVEGLEELLAPLRLEGQLPPAYGGVISDLWNLLESKKQELETVDWAHLGEDAETPRLRRSRDAAAELLHAMLIEVSATFDGTFGEGAAEEVLGLGPGLRNIPEQMLELSRKAHFTLGEEGLKLPPAKLTGVTLDLAALRSQIEVPMEELARSIEALAKEKTEFDESFKAKLLVMADFDNCYSQCVRILKGLYRLSGNQLLSDRITSRLRRSAAPGTEPEEVEEVEEVEVVEVFEEPETGS